MTTQLIRLQTKFCKAQTRDELITLAQDALDTVSALEGKVGFRDARIAQLEKQIKNQEKLLDFYI
jgi:hypothetical protein